ncbi:hypothetical protein RAD16_02525 [Bradyrhizobium sp. 18BD]
MSKSPTEDEQSQGVAKEIQQQWNEHANKERYAWLSMPRVHLAVFDELARAERIAEDPRMRSASPEVKRAIDSQKTKRELKAREAVKMFGWTAQRFSEFKKLALTYRNEPSIEHYLTIRTEFPELDIQIGMSGGIDPLFAIQDKCKQCGINPDLIASAMDGFEPGIDRLCLTIMECIVAREKISGPGSYERRRAAISDAMVNYLIAFMLEGLDWCGDEVRIPASLILLIRHQLGPLKGDFHKEYQSRQTMKRAAWIAGQQLQPNEKLSINRLIKLASTGDNPVPRSTAARWLKDPEFQKELKFSTEFDEISRSFHLKK